MPLKKVIDGVVSDMTSEEEATFRAGLPSDSEIAASKLEMLRIERNAKLAETDWTQSRDITLSNDDDWKKYRQELRDITKTYKSLEDVKWPTAPSE